MCNKHSFFNIMLKLVFCFVLLFGLYCVASNDAVAESHPVSLTGSLFGDGCRWGISNSTLYIWADDEVYGVLPSNVNDSYSFWPWYEHSVSKVVIEPGVASGESLSYLFYYLTSCTTMDLSGLDTTQAVDMTRMFNSCYRLTSLDLSGFNTSNVQNMSYMFYGCYGLTSLDLSSFDTSSVTTMASMFYNCYGLTGLNVSSWCVENVVNMNSMFYKCSGLLSLDLASWNTSSVTNMSFMFYNCSGLIGVNVYSWDVGNVIDMGSMFSNCSSLTNLNVSYWSTGSVTNMNNMFYNCSSLTSLDLSSWDTRGVENMSYMFCNCSSLEEIDLSSFNTRSVLNMSYMFCNCSSLEDIDVTSFDTRFVLNMSSLFYGCSKLTSLDLSNFDTSFADSMSGMFSNCDLLERVLLSNSFSFKGKYVDSSHNYLCSLPGRNSVFSDFWISSDGEFGPYTYYWLANNFDDLSFGKTIDLVRQDISHMDCALLYSDGYFIFQKGNVPDENHGDLIASYTGLHRTSFISTNYISWRNYLSSVSHVVIRDVISPESTEYWFYNMSNLEDIVGLDKIDCTYLTDMFSMFSGCSSLTSLDLSSWNTSNVESMGSMFRNCSNLTNLDISGFDMSNVQNAYGMFNGCSSLNTIVLGENFVFGLNCFLPVPASSDYSGRWVREDGLYGPYAPVQLADEYDGSLMSGVWVLEEGHGLCAILYEDGDLVFQSGDTIDDSKGGVIAVYYNFDLDNVCPWSSNVSFVRRVVFNTYVSPVSSVSSWFCNMSNLVEIVNIDLFDTSNMISMYQMFYGCSSLMSLDLSGFDTSNVTSMYYMFYNCSSLTSLDLSGFDTSNVTSMYYMFYNCSSLTSLNVSNFDMRGLTSMSYMFSGCNRLNSVVLSENFKFKGFDVTNSSFTLPKLSGNYTGNWLKADKSYGPYSPSGLSDVYDDLDADKAGLWVAELRSDAKCALLYDDGYLVFQDGDTADENHGNLVGVFSGFDTNNSGYPTWRNNGSSVIHVVFETEVAPVYLGYWFQNMSHLVDIENINLLDTANVTSMYYMFSGCSSLTSLDLSSFDTRNVTDMAYMFYNCSGLTNLDVSSFDMRSVVSLSSMVYGCNNLSSVVLSEYFVFETFSDNGSVSYSFTLPKLSGNYTGNWLKADKSYGPYSPSGLSDVYADLDTDKAGLWVAELRSDAKCALLYDDGYLVFQDGDTADENHGNLVGVFSGFDTNNSGYPTWRNNSSSVIHVVFETEVAPVYLGYWFQNMSHLIDIENINLLDTANVTSMYYMFYGCSSLTSLDLSSFDTLSVTDMQRMFQGCLNLVDLNLSGFDTRNVTDMSYMFYNCASLTSLDVSCFNVSSVTNMTYMFYNCLGLTSLDLSDFDVSSVTNMSYMFYNCSSLVSLNVSNFGTRSVTNMYYMFYGCSSLTSLDLSNFDTSNVISMNSMFCNCTLLEDVDVSGFDTGSVTNMNGVFRNCSSLQSLDLSNWNTFACNDMYSMFDGCYNLNSVILGDCFSFVGNDLISDNFKALLPLGGNGNYPYDGMWIRDDGLYGPLSRQVLRDSYSADMSGRWICHTSDVCVVLYSNGDLVFDNGLNIDIERGSVCGCWSLGVYSSYTDVPWYNNRSLVTNVFFVSDICPLSTAYWFYNCYNLVSVDFSNLDTSNVVDMSYMFYNCSGLTSLDLSDVSCGSVVSIYNMFDYCYNLGEVILGENFSFVGSDSSCCTFYKVEWQNVETGVCYSAIGLKDNYDGVTMAGRYVATDKSLMSAYAILYENGTLVFQRGNSTDPDMGEVVSYWTNFEYSSSSVHPWTDSAYKDLVLTVVFKDLVRPSYCDYWFYGLRNCAYMNLANLDVSNVSNMSYMFSSCGYSVDTTVVGLSNFNVSKVTNFSYMFYYSGFVEMDLSNWVLNDNQNISINMEYMFEGAHVRTVGELNWNFSRVIRIFRMFNYARSLEVFPFEHCCDMRNVTSCGYLFSYCSSLQSFEMDYWDLRRATDCYYLFRGCSSLVDVKIGDWDVRSATTFYAAFSGCSSLKSLVVGDWTWRSLDSAISNVFSGCSSLEYLKVGDWYINSCYFSSLFGDLRSLRVLDVGDWYFYSVTASSLSLSSLESVHVKNWTFVIGSSDSSVSGLFKNCESLRSFVVDDDFEMRYVSSVPEMFYGCSQLVEFYIGGTWNLSYCKDANSHSMFSGCGKLKTFFVGNWLLNNALDFHDMFARCYSLESADLGGLSPSCATNMSLFFYRCFNLKAVRFGENWSFSGDNIVSPSDRALLPDPDSNSPYTGKWIQETKLNGPYTARELRDSVVWSADKAGWWVWEGDTVDITFNLPDWFPTGVVFSDDVNSTDNRSLTVSCYYKNVPSIPEAWRVCEWCSGTEPVLESYDESRIDEYTVVMDVFSVVEYMNPVFIEDGGSDSVGDYVNAYNVDENLVTGSMSGCMLSTEGYNLVLPMSGYYVISYRFVGYGVSFVDNRSVRLYGHDNVTDFVNDPECLLSSGDTIEVSDLKSAMSNLNTVNLRVKIYPIYRAVNTNIVFGDSEIEFTLLGGEKAEFLSMPGNLSYQVYEETPAGWVLVGQQNSNGKIVSESSANVVFTNQYDPDNPTVQFTALKRIVNSSGIYSYPSANLYQFELSLVSSPDNAIVEFPFGTCLPETVSNKSGGIIDFSSIVLKTNGQYVFEITEVVHPDDEFMTWDTHAETITVDVSTDGAVRKAVVITDDDGLVFTNELNDRGSLIIEKVIEDDAWLSGCSFEIDVLFRDQFGAVPSSNLAHYLASEAVSKGYHYDASAGVMSCSIDELNNPVIIENIPWELSYEVSEVPDAMSSYEFVSVSNDSGSLSRLVPTVTSVVTNRLVTVPISVVIQARKDADFDYESGDFVFELLDSSGELVEQVSNGVPVSGSDGCFVSNVLFTDVMFDSVGDYVYYIRERSGSDDNIEYDNDFVEVTVHVGRDGVTGQLVGDVEYRKTKNRRIVSSTHP